MQRRPEAAKFATPAESIRLIGQSRRAFDRPRSNPTTQRSSFPGCHRDADFSGSKSSTGRSNRLQDPAAETVLDVVLTPPRKPVCGKHEPTARHGIPQSFLQRNVCGGRIEIDCQRSPRNPLAG